MVVVYGDTNSTLSGALAAAKLNVPVAHVEAGLRSFIRSMPEEVNRVLVDRLSTHLFCPSEVAVANLRNEGMAEGVHDVGDVMLDANRLFAPLALERSTALTDAGVEPKRYVLATVHREANMGREPLRAILAGLAGDEPVVFPAHPRTSAALGGHRARLPNVRLLPPAGYLDFTALTAQARVVATDSGGVQKEAYWHGVPCVTLRDRDRMGRDGRNRLEHARRLVRRRPDRRCDRRRDVTTRPSRPVRGRSRRRAHRPYDCRLMTDRIRIGVVGLGYWGPNLARNFNELAELAFVCDANEEYLAFRGHALPGRDGDAALRRPARRRHARRGRDRDAGPDARRSRPPRARGRKARVRGEAGRAHRGRRRIRRGAGGGARPRPHARPPAALPPGRPRC